MTDPAFKALKPGNIFERSGNKYMVHTIVTNLAGETTWVGIMPAFGLSNAASMTLQDAVGFKQDLVGMCDGSLELVTKTILAPE